MSHQRRIATRVSVALSTLICLCGRLAPCVSAFSQSGYDNVGNRLTRSSSLPGVTNQAFGYDANDRLNGDQYDNNGNTKAAPVSQPTSVNPQQLLGTDSYDGENRLTTRPEQPDPTSRWSTTAMATASRKSSTARPRATS